MPIAIRPYLEQHEPAVHRFNERLRAASGDPNLVFYRRSHPEWLSKVDGGSLYNQYFVALDDDEVRGAYALKYEKFFLANQGEYTVACYHHPLSEGIIDRKYSSVGSLLLRDALAREPMLYALGMGGSERPLAQMLKAAGWSLRPVPFYFRVVRPYRFLRQMQTLRQSRWKRWLMDLGAVTGVGGVALTAAQFLKRSGKSETDSFEVIGLDIFTDWTDILWKDTKALYRLSSVRDCKILNRLYPSSERHLTKLSVMRLNAPVGWAVVAERRRDPKFGELRVGSIVDCWAPPENADIVIRAATQALEKQGMDLIVSNQSHSQWCRALERSGFFGAESNFIFATSKKHSALLQPYNFLDFHLTRADGDGLPRNF